MVEKVTARGRLLERWMRISRGPSIVYRWQFVLDFHPLIHIFALLSVISVIFIIFEGGTPEISLVEPLGRASIKGNAHLGLWPALNT
jgi:hypothetical protein